MKKIMIFAYANFNLGDDLFIKVLCERYSDTRFVLYAPKKYNTLFKEISNISIVSSDSIILKGINFICRTLKIYRSCQTLVANGCDAVVNIGGSLFMQNKSWREALEYRMAMQIKNKPFFLLGANFGPYSDREYYEGYKEVFKTYTDICFREKYSYELFNDLSNVRVAEDVIFQLKEQEVHTEKNSIVISVIKPSRKQLPNYDEIYYKKIKDITVYFIEKGYKVTLMSFCEYEGDEEAIEAIMNLIPKKYLNMVAKHLYRLNIEETLNIIAKSNFVVATRFHAMILGWVYNKPVFPIAYSDKMTNVIKGMKFKGSYTDLDNIATLKPEEVFECMKTNKIDVSKQAQNAEKHFEKLDDYLLQS